MIAAYKSNISVCSDPKGRCQKFKHHPLLHHLLNHCTSFNEIKCMTVSLQSAMQEQYFVVLKFPFLYLRLTTVPVSTKVNDFLTTRRHSRKMFHFDLNQGGRALWGKTVKVTKNSKPQFESQEH